LKSVLVLALALTAACHSSRAYHGHARLPEEVATMVVYPPSDAFDVDLHPPRTRIARVDDKTFEHTRVTLLPGTHEVVITAETESRHEDEETIVDQFVVEIDVEAGKTYLVTGRQVPDEPLELWILDKEDGRILAQTAE
jgi:hypothetical protein